LNLKMRTRRLSIQFSGYDMEVAMTAEMVAISRVPNGYWIRTYLPILDMDVEITFSDDELDQIMEARKCI